jgi:hypothetical protein
MIYVYTCMDGNGRYVCNGRGPMIHPHVHTRIHTQPPSTRKNRTAPPSPPPPPPPRPTRWLLRASSPPPTTSLSGTTPSRRCGTSSRRKWPKNSRSPLLLPPPHSPRRAPWPRRCRPLRSSPWSGGRTMRRSWEPRARPCRRRREGLYRFIYSILFDKMEGESIAFR